MEFENMEEYTHIIIETDKGFFDTWIFEKEEFLKDKYELVKDAKSIYLAKKII